MPQLDKFTYFTQFFWSCLFLLTFYIAIISIIFKCLQISAARILVFKIQYPKACFFLTCLFGGLIIVRAGWVLYKNISALFASLPTCHNWAVPGRLNQTSISDYFLFCIHTQPMGPSLLSTVREAGLRGPLQMDSQGSPEWEALGELEPASGQRLGGGGRMEDDARLINQREHKKRKINQIWQLGELREKRIEQVAKSNYNIGNRMFDMKKELLDKLELKFNEDGAFKGARLHHLLDEYFDSKKKGYTDRYCFQTYSEWCRALDNPNSDFYNKMEAHLNKERSIDASNRAQSPLDQFSIVPFYPLQIGKFYCSFTNASFFLLLTLLFVLFYFHLVTKKGGGKLVPNAFQSVLELIYDFVPNLVNEQIGGLSGNVKQQFFPCISVTFTFSLFRNLQGMIPYSFTVTSHFIVTLGLSFSLFIGITIVGFVKNGLHFLSFSLPAGVPLPLAPFLVLLELIPHCFRALSLGIRLFANMMAGHSLVKILSGFAWTMLCMNDLFYFIGSTGPFFIVLALTGLELGVAILQAYVFTILICIYLNDAINLH